MYTDTSLSMNVCMEFDCVIYVMFSTSDLCGLSFVSRRLIDNGGINLKISLTGWYSCGRTLISMLYQMYTLFSRGCH